VLERRAEKEREHLFGSAPAEPPWKRFLKKMLTTKTRSERATVARRGISKRVGHGS
jgi:hypothetical protein